MLLRKENKQILGKLYLLVMLFSFTSLLNVNLVSAQCEILVEHEPTLSKKNKSPNNASQKLIRNRYASWENMDHVKKSDNQYATISLDPRQISNYLDINDLRMNLAEGDEVVGINVIVEGHVEGATSKLTALKISLLNGQGLEVGTNKYNQITYGEDWALQSTDEKWVYGRGKDLWEVPGINEDFVNFDNFGVRIQLRNKGKGSAKVFIDQIRVELEYKPVMKICDHDCITFNVVEDPNAVKYKWWIPEDFDVLPGTEITNFINLTTLNKTVKTYEVCVTVMGRKDIISECCRKFVIDDCTPSNIGDKVFINRNADGIQKSSDRGIRNMDIHLFSEDGILIKSTKTDGSGFYRFNSINHGYYYIKADIPNNMYPTVAFAGNNSQKDNNISNQNGYGTTDVFYIGPGVNESSIDLGLYKKTKAGDFVWNDLNGDGIQSFGEPGIEGVELQLFNNNDIVVGTTISDTVGHYTFLIGKYGEYYIKARPVADYTITRKNQGSSDRINSKFDSLGVSDKFTILHSKFNQRIDLGLYKKGVIGDFVWFDSNENGIQDTPELGIEKVIMKLYNSSDEQLDSVVTDSTGYYLFEDVDPGDYYISMNTDDNYVATGVHEGGNDDKDSDFIIIEDQTRTELFSFVSCDSILKIDAGVTLKRSSINGITWLDSNKNALYDEGDDVLSGISIHLFDNEHNEIDSTFSGENGEYNFANVKQDSYYVVFSIDETYSFTTRNEGNDNVDTDVTNDITLGSTSIFEITAGAQVEKDAGYILNTGKIEGVAWLDMDINNIHDFSDIELVGIKVELINENDEIIDFSYTNDNGYYSLSDVRYGRYYIQFSNVNGYAFVEPNVGQGTTHSNVTGQNGVGTTDYFELPLDGVTVKQNVGFIDNTSDIVGIVWDDSNMNGRKDEAESVIPDVRIHLFGEDGVEIISVSTFLNGEFVFPQVIIGTYYLVFDLVEGESFTVSREGVDSDVTGANGTGSTDLFTIEMGGAYVLANAGIITEKTTEAAKIGDFVWFDTNENGIQDDNEEGVNGIEVKLYNEDKVIIDSQVTGANADEVKGGFLFENVENGNYYVQFGLSDEYVVTEANQGESEIKDSDVTGTFGEGTTDWIYVTNNKGYYHVDAGLILAQSTLALDDSSLDVKYIGDHSEIIIYPLNEFGIDKFEVYKKYESYDWELLATIESEGKGNYLTLDYDLDEDGNYYYQVKEYDFDGKVNTSKVVSIQVSNEAKNADISVYPNPTSELIMVRENGRISRIQTIDIIDPVGKIVRSYNAKTNTKSVLRMHELHLDGLLGGIYILKINYKNDSVSQSILLIK